MFPVLALAVLAGSGSSAFILVETESLRKEVQALADDGHNVLTFSALKPEEPTLISRASCEALATQSGVRAAGVLEPERELNVLPVGNRLPAQRASITLFPELKDADLLVGPKLSDHASGGFVVRIGDEPAKAVVAEPHAEGLGTGFGITLPPRASASTSEHCVVILDPFADAQTTRDALAAQLHTSGNAVTSTELLVPTNDPVDTYLKRPSRWLPLLLGALGALATAISTRLRASEIAVYRMSGTSATSVVSLLTVEALLIAGTAAASAATASAVLAKGHLDATVPVVWGLAMAGVWTLTSIVASLDLAVRSPNDLAKDR